MTIQWKKLINFDVPQKLWDLAEKIANERGWTTEAVICDAAEKYLGYIEEDPDNEMIFIQIPKSLYDRIETVANKSVEHEIEREMTEWVELVEEIYEESEEEESVEPFLSPISDTPKEITQYYLVKYESDWADEMDIEGFDILTQEDKDYFESLTPTDDKPLIHYVGTNEEIEYWNLERFLDCYTWTPISKEEAETVKKLLNPSYGHFYYPEIDEEEEEEENENYYRELKSEKIRFNVFPYFDKTPPYWVSNALRREDRDSDFVGRFESNTNKDAIIALASQYDIAEEEINFIYD